MVWDDMVESQIWWGFGRPTLCTDRSKFELQNRNFATASTTATATSNN